MPTFNTTAVQQFLQNASRPTTPSTAGVQFTALEPVTLGREANKITVEVASFPPVTAEPSAKDPAFSITVLALSNHLDAYDFAELQDCLTRVVPGTHAAAKNQVSDLMLQLRAAPFQLIHLTASGFVFPNSDLAPTYASQCPPDQRPAHLKAFRFSVDIHASRYAPAGTNLDFVPPLRGELDLPLPQHPMPHPTFLGRLFPAAPATPLRPRQRPETTSPTWATSTLSPISHPLTPSTARPSPPISAAPSNPSSNTPLGHASVNSSASTMSGPSTSPLLRPSTTYASSSPTSS